MSVTRGSRASPHVTLMTTLRDGTCDAFIISAERRDEGIALECTITSGEARGDVVNIVTSSFVARDPLSLLGIARTLIVSDNEIRVTQRRASHATRRVRRHAYVYAFVTRKCIETRARRMRRARPA